MKNLIILSLLISFSFNANAFIHKKTIDENVYVYKDHIILRSESKQLKVDTACKFNPNNKNLRFSIKENMLAEKRFLLVKEKNKVKRCEIKKISLL